VKLFSKYSNPTFVITVAKRYGRTDGETDDTLWHR